MAESLQAALAKKVGVFTVTNILMCSIVSSFSTVIDIVLSRLNCIKFQSFGGVRRVVIS